MASSGRIDELQKKFEENPRRYFAPLANEYRKVGDLQQAILICQEHLPQQPGHMSGHIVYGQALFEAGRLDEARAIFETALTLDPENLIALRHLGDIARNSGNTEAAKGWYKRVLEADPRNEEIGQIMSAMSSSGAPPAAAAKPTPIEVPVVPVPAKASAPAAASAPTAELSVEAIQKLAAARSAQTARPSGARVMPAVPLDSVPTLVPGVPKVPDAASPPPAPVAPPKPRRSSRSVTPLDWNDVQETPAAGTPSQSSKGTGYAGDATDLLEIPDITLETKPVAADAVEQAHASARGDLDLGAVFQADPLAIASRPASAPVPTPQLEGFETTSLELPDLPPAAPVTAVPAASVTEASAPPEPPPLEFVDVGDSPADATASQSAAPFVTTTMAELYVQQGHIEQALEIYEQLSAQKPGDPELAARVQSLRLQIANATMADTAREALPPTPSPEPRGEPSAPAPAPEASAPFGGAGGPTIREFLLALIDGMADQVYSSNGAAHSTAGTWGSIDALFEGLSPAEPDASAADMLGIAFDDNVEVPLLFDVGVGSVAETPGSASGLADTTGQRFSLDQFFSSEAGGVAGRRSGA